MSDDYLDDLVVLTMGAWLLVVAAAIVVGLDVAMGFIIWFGGFLIVAECFPPDRIRLRTRKLLRRVVILGYLGFAAAGYVVVQSWM
jgi:hypothetical protein